MLFWRLRRNWRRLRQESVNCVKEASLSMTTARPLDKDCRELNLLLVGWLVSFPFRSLATTVITETSHLHYHSVGSKWWTFHRINWLSYHLATKFHYWWSMIVFPHRLRPWLMEISSFLFSPIANNFVGRYLCKLTSQSRYMTEWHPGWVTEWRDFVISWKMLKIRR